MVRLSYKVMRFGTRNFPNLLSVGVMYPRAMQQGVVAHQGRRLKKVGHERLAMVSEVLLSRPEPVRVFLLTVFLDSRSLARFLLSKAVAKL